MRTGKNGVRRVAALVCSVALFATLLPVQVLAADEATSEPLAAVTSLEESGEEKAPEQGETGIQPETENACTKSEDCVAETHEEGCPKYVAPAEEEDTDPVVSCTKSEDCAAETHEEGCPKYVAPAGEEDADPVVSCTKSEDCAAETHEEGCPKYVAPEEEGSTKYVVLENKGAEQITTVTITEEDVSDLGEDDTGIAVAFGRLAIDPASVTSLKIVTEGSAVLSPSDFYYLRDNIQDLAYIDMGQAVCAENKIPDIAFCESLGTAENNWNPTGRPALATVILPSNITEIGKYAFYGSGLQTIELPSTLKVIGNNAFGNCSQFAGILELPDGLITIDSNAFNKTPISGDLVIPDSVETIGQNAFMNCGITGTLTIGKSVKTIGNNGFAGNLFTGNLVIPDSVERIDNWVFSVGAFASGTWTLGSGLIHIGDSAMKGICSGNTGTLTISPQLEVTDSSFEANTFLRVIFEEGVTKTGKRTVQNSTSIREAILPSTLEEVGDGTFNGCNNLVKAVLPDGLDSIGSYAFCNTAFPGIYIPKSVGTILDRAFDSLPEKSVIYVNDTLICNLMNTDLSNSAKRRYAPNKTALAVTNGGSFAADTQFTAGTLATPTKNGAIFEGWYDNAEFTGEAVAAAEAGKTYYAKWLDLGVADVSLEYRQTQTITAPAGVTFSNWKSEDPSVATVDNGTITAVGVGKTTISVEAAANGQNTVAKISVTVTPMNITFGAGNGEDPGGTITYQYNGGQAPAFSQFATFYPAKISDGSVSPVEGSSAVTLVEGKDIVFNYDAGAGSNDYEYLPLNVTSEANPETGLPVTVKLLNENYRFVTASNVTPGAELQLSVVVTDENLTESDITGLGTATTSFTYDGTGKAAVTGLTDIAADNISEFTLHFHGWQGTAFAEQHLTGDASVFTEEAVAKIAPTEPGSYLMILTGVSENHYAYQSWIMTINKATVTITAADKTVIAGDKDGLPSLNNPTEGKDYTVTGLAAGHSLTTAPTLNYSEEANVDAVATYSIIPSEAAADENYYTLQYVNGTLHVEKIAIIEGANQTWTKESGKDLVIRSNADFSDFLGVTVNDVELVQNQDYTAKSGSTIVTIKADYLNSLAAGDYKIAIVSDTGSAVTKFTVKAEAAGNSDTSNNDNTAGGNTGSTTTQSGSGIVYYTCPACGYHDWTAGADGYKCNHCGYVESVKQLSGYGNVKGVYEPKTSAAAAQSASATSSSAIPQTGDESQPLVWVTLVVVSGAALAGLAVYRKKRSDK